MHPLTRKIAALQRRLAVRELAVAACRIAATMIAAAIVLGAADYFVRFRDPGLRILATATLATAVFWAVYRWWYLPHRRLVPLVVARRVESHFPQLRDSLASAIEFLQQEENDDTAGSAQLRRLVVAEAQTTVDQLALDEVIDRRPLRRAAIWLAFAGVALALCIVWDARAVATAVARLAVPLGSAEWPRQHHLAFRNVPQRIAAGQTFEVELVDTRGQLPDEVRIEYRVGHGSSRQSISEPMIRSGDAMVARRENVRHSFAYRAHGGDDDTMRWRWVEVVEPPQLKSLAITTHPPDYTGLPAAPAERHLDVLAGTGIEVSGTASKPLSAVRIIMEGIKPIAASVRSGADGRQPRGFHIAPEQWIATKSGPYRLELSDAEGLAAVVGQWNLRTQPDSPPSVSWQRPSEDLYVTPAATVPITLDVKDNLAIHRVDLVYERSDRSRSERERQPAEPRIELYRGTDTPTKVASGGARVQGENRLVEFSWDIARLDLPVGAQLTMAAEAADYHPGTGRTIGPRRITIITDDEFEKRLADRQAQIVRQLERALAIEQATREEVRRLEIQRQDLGALTSGNRNALQSAELNQRRIARMLVDEAEGIPPLISALLADVEMNRLPTSDMREAMERLALELERLSSGPLNIADSELTAARKATEAVIDSDHLQSLSSALAAAGAAQDNVIATLERLISELSEKADYHRFARLLSELRQDQIAHEQSARAEIGIETLPLRLNELTRVQRAGLSRAAAGQQAIATRFDKIEQGMDRLAQQLADSDDNEAAEVLAEAVDLARRMAIGASMQETAHDLSENRVGRALASEMQIAADLQQVLDVLRMDNGRESLVDKLRGAQDRLAARREQLAALRDEIAKTEAQATASDERQLAELNGQQQKLGSQIDGLARQLDRLQAFDAGQSTRSAANRLDNRAPDQTEHPSPSQEIAKAEQDLEQAARQLDQRRQQAEDDLVLEMVRRFQAELTKLVQRQQRVVERTLELDKRRQPNGHFDEAGAKTVADLAAEERSLAEVLREHTELLFGLGAVRVSLEEAQRRLIAAADLLDSRETGLTTQRAERRALARLEGMLDAFAQTAAEASQNQNAQRGTAAAAVDEQPQRRPTFELLEVKMLRMLQVDLNERTRERRRRVSGLDGPAAEALRAELEREARELAAEQRRLAELVQNMLTRDNEETQ